MDRHRPSTWRVAVAALATAAAASVAAGCVDAARQPSHATEARAATGTRTASVAHPSPDRPPAADRVDPLHAPGPPGVATGCAPARADLAALRAPDGAVVPPIEREEELAPFLDALARLDRGVATDHVRIAVYGDSNLTMDYPTGRIRRVLSRAFGEGGHGFVAAAQPWSHYQHRDVRHGVISGWKAYAITTAPTGDGLYGLAGIAAENEWQGATTFVQTALPGAPIGTRVARLEVFHLRRRGGGTFDVVVDGERRERVSTALDREAEGRAPRLGVTTVTVDEGEHRLDLVASSAGVTRLFGVALERATPGVVIDTFGVGALNTRSQARTDRALAVEMLRARRYDLVIFATGANDVFTMDDVPEAFGALVAMHREALPGVPILVMSPADRGARRSFPKTLEVVAQRRRLAEEHRLAYWSLFDAMGGRDSMARFVREGRAKRDAIHWNEVGGDWAGDQLVHALVRAYDARLAGHPAAGCAPSPPTTHATASRIPTPPGR